MTEGLCDVSNFKRWVRLCYFFFYFYLRIVIRLYFNFYFEKSFYFYLLYQ